MMKNSVGVVCGNLIFVIYGNVEVVVFVYILLDNFIKVSEWIFKIWIYFYVLFVWKVLFGE